MPILTTPQPAPAASAPVQQAAARPLRLAYLTTQYPAVSHTFIRRELLALEGRGHTILRLAIRAADAPPVDPLDEAELRRTLHCLAQPASRFLRAGLACALANPPRYLRALGLALRSGLRSERGVARHLAYLAEACLLLRELQRAAIQHVHVHFGTNAADVARLVRRLGGPSYSFTVHGPDEFDAPRAFDLQGKAADAAFVVAISDFTGAQLRRWVRPEHWDRIHVVHCTVGPEFFAAARPVDPESQTLVCVGRLAPQKGQLLLLDAFADVAREFSRARLVLVGDGELRGAIEQRRAALGLQGRVEITGYLRESDVRACILAARAMVLPSFAEGLPMAIMEAFALGRPVVSTYIAGIPELVRDGETGWLAPAGNRERLAASLRAALTAPAAQLDRMAAAGAALVRRGHDSATEAARLEQLICTALDTPPRA